jgi:hypothetical protein
VQVIEPTPAAPEPQPVTQSQPEPQPPARPAAVVAPVSAPAAPISVPAAAPLPAAAADARPAEVRPDDQPAAPASRQTFSQAELDEMLAPVALYPDSLLTQVLMAATYPLEVVQADRWRRGNANLAGDALAGALEEQPWDASVKSLINTPDVLSMMSDKLDWTVRLGDAFIGQQQQVMDTVQDLRRRAQEAGTLKNTPEQRVTTLVQAEPVVEREIIIERSDPDVVYVPVYDPYVSYGTWWHPYHRPFFWCPPTYPVGWSGVWFGLSYHCGPAWGYAWGRPNWHHHHVDIDVHRHARFNSHIDRDRIQRQIDRRDDGLRVSRGTWVHDPAHRRGVWYRDTDVARRFNAPTPPQLGRGDRNSAIRTRTASTDTLMGPRITTPSNAGRTTTGNRVPNTKDFMGPRITTPSNAGRTTNTDGLTTNAQKAPQLGETKARPPVQSPGLKRDDPRPTPSLTPARRDALANDGNRGGDRGGDNDNTNVRSGQQRQDPPSERVRVIRPTPVRVAPPSVSADRGTDRGADRGGDRGAAFSEVNRDGGSVRSESRRGSVSRAPSESSGFRSAPAPRLGSSSPSPGPYMGP